MNEGAVRGSMRRMERGRFGQLALKPAHLVVKLGRSLSTLGGDFLVPVLGVCAAGGTGNRT